MRPERILAILGEPTGVGGACARLAAEQGWGVLLAGDDARALQRASEDLGEHGVTYRCKLDAEIGVHNALAAAQEAFDRVDAVVLCLPQSPPKAIAELTSSELVEHVGRVVKICGLTLEVFGGRLLQQREEDLDLQRRRADASITFVLNDDPETARPDGAAAAASAGAALQLMRAAAVELTPKRIRANLLSAPLTTGGSEADGSLAPLGRPVNADEIAASALMLASGDAGPITGHLMRLDGGRRAQTFR